MPAELGGASGGLPELVAALRTVARRDVTVAVAHGKTFLGSVPTWVAGTDEQRRTLARRVLAGAVVSWGLTEPGHGSDLLAGELTAEPTADGGWRLDGAKWPHQQRHPRRPDLGAGPDRARGRPARFSQLLVDKHALAPGTWGPLPKEPTHGIRGADISGIRFTGAKTPADALTGRPGDGLDIVLRSLQLTRTVCTSPVPGRRGARAAAGPRLRGRTRHGTAPPCCGCRWPAGCSDGPRPRWPSPTPASLVAARAAHHLPGEMSVVSAAVKAGVPEIVQLAVDDLAELLGARGFLTEHHAHGAFQKLERDHRIVAIFDGSTAVNRVSLINQFPVLARLHRKGAYDAEGLAATVTAQPVPPVDAGALRLFSRTGCSVVQALPAAAERLAALAATGALPRRVPELAAALAAEAAAVADAMAAPRPAGRGTPPEAFEAARRYERCFAGAAAAHLLLADPGDQPRAGSLTAALERALELLRPGHEAPEEAYEPMLETLAEPAKELIP